MKLTMPLGPLMIDCEGIELSSSDKEILQHPLVGGIILFSRNYESPAQVTELCKSIHAVRAEPLLIAVDHEGGRVQRFREGFTRIPCMQKLGKLFLKDKQTALDAAEQLAWLMAAELREVGVDFSFAPVLDLNYGCSDIIGDRAFSADKYDVAALATAFHSGLATAGMRSVGKHFPGHGAVVPDSHIAIPVDERDFEEIMENDIYPFQALTEAGMNGVMPAHIIYQQLDPLPAGFSSFWIQTILRQKLGFNGVVFSDDLSMEGATQVGNFEQRARAAITAGCDMALVCNNRSAAEQVIDALAGDYEINKESSQRLSVMRANPAIAYADLRISKKWNQCYKTIQMLEAL
jgi:beta-N-acetylhexosaminidase